MAVPATWGLLRDVPPSSGPVVDAPAACRAIIRTVATITVCTRLGLGLSACAESRGFVNRVFGTAFVVRAGPTHLTDADVVHGPDARHTARHRDQEQGQASMRDAGPG